MFILQSFLYRNCYRKFYTHLLHLTFITIFPLQELLRFVLVCQLVIYNITIFPLQELLLIQTKSFYHLLYITIFPLQELLLNLIFKMLNHLSITIFPLQELLLNDAPINTIDFPYYNLSFIGIATQNICCYFVNSFNYNLSFIGIATLTRQTIIPYAYIITIFPLQELQHNLKKIDYFN